MGFSKLLAAQVRTPLRTVVLPPAAFADTYEGRPEKDVALGLRLLSESDLDSARGEASKILEDQDLEIDDRIDAFNDRLMAFAVARGTCQPGDISTPYFTFAEDTVRDALTPAGIRRVFDALQVLAIACSPLTPEASDEDLDRLTALFAEGKLDALAPQTARRARRLLRAALDEILPPPPEKT